MKTRFCPSPTGAMHLGNIRTALFSALLAHAQGGGFLLRIEDTDRERSEEKYTQAIMEDLQWLGLLWDEGPEKDKGNGPYWQSQRAAIYDKYYQQLEDAGLAYPCFCSDAQLAITRKTQRAAGKPPRYPETCRHLSAEEIAEKRAAGLKPTLRFHVPNGHTVEFLDIVKGVQRFASDDIGDFIIRRADGTASFMFCNAIDDALMGVTHVLRGEDHLTNTPRQIMIQEALGLAVPQYGHISLITGLTGDKLSKRRGDFSLEDLRQNGILSLALLNYLARLGHRYDNNDLMDVQALAAQFSAEALGKSSAKFDKAQLLYWQKRAVAELPDDALWDWMGDAVHTLVPVAHRADFAAAVKTMVAAPEDAFYWAEVFFGSELNINEEQKAILQEAGADFFEQALRGIAAHGADANEVIAFLKTHGSWKGKALFLPLRVALTGEMHGPDLPTVFTLLGADGLERRFTDALNMVQ